MNAVQDLKETGKAIKIQLMKLVEKPKDSQSNLSKTRRNIREIVRGLNSKSKQDVCSGNISLNACCKTMAQPKKKKKHLAGSCRTADSVNPAAPFSLGVHPVFCNVLFPIS